MGCLKIPYHYSESALEDVSKHFLRVSSQNGARGKKGTNLYPFGSVLRRSSTPNAYFEANGIETEGEDFGKYYSYGYQGQFSMEDMETGWNSFELRNYDANIGRWTSVDPYRVGYSPYIGMSNNPTNLTDPDGGCPEGQDCPGFEEGVSNTDMALEGFTFSSPAGDKAKFEFKQRMRSDSWMFGIHTNHYETQWQRDFNTFAGAGMNAISATIAMPVAATILGETAAQTVAITSTIAVEVNAITTYAYISANTAITAKAGAASLGIGKFGYDLLRSRNITILRARHSWLRGPIYNAEKAMQNLNIMPSRLQYPFIPADPTSDSPWGIIFNLYKSTPPN